RKMNLIGMFPNSPLFVAVQFGDPDVTRALLASGADINEKDQDGLTALDWAVVANQTDVVKALLAAGASVNTVDRFGYTPLLYASTIDFGDAETALALIGAGADLKVKDKEGKTALEHARKYPYLYAALKKAGAKQ